MGRWERAGAGMRQRGMGHGKGREAKSAKQQPHRIGKPVGVVNHGPTMGNLATGSRENALNSGTAVRCPQG